MCVCMCAFIDVYVEMCETLCVWCVCVPCVHSMRAKTHKWKAAQGVIEVADILRLLKTKANRQHHVPESCLVHV